MRATISSPGGAPTGGGGASRPRWAPLVLAVGACAVQSGTLRTFPDRPAVWSERDDGDLPEAPEARGTEDEHLGIFVRDTFTREADRILSLEAPHPALDVNALDEIPCSTWFCPRHHLAPLADAELLGGPPATEAPQLPFTISGGKVQGVAPGFVAKDAAGRKYLVKFDPTGHAGLASGAEIVGNLLLHAAGYNVPGAFVVDVGRAELLLEPDAEIKLSGVSGRRFTPPLLDEMLRAAAWNGKAQMRAVAIPWISGKVLGGFDSYGRRDDDANDRIDHQDRRSLRATYLMFGWLNVTDPGVKNSVDAYVEEGGRRFVRHYLVDFGTALGAGTIRIKSVSEGREYDLELDRLLGAAFSLGIYQRRWQGDVGLWKIGADNLPEVGWLHPADDWRPEDFRTSRKSAAHLRMTERDGYWAAKVITSFTDAHIDTVVRAASYDDASAAFVARALKARRDRIGERYLVSYAAVEAPSIAADGRLCFRDLAIARGYARAGDTRYRVRVTGEDGVVRRRAEERATGAAHCLPRLPDGGAPYLAVTIESVIAGRVSRPTAVHLRWRPAARRYAVVGIDRPD